MGSASVPSRNAAAGQRVIRMRVLVTGACGFIGKALVERLIRRGDRVIALNRSCAGLAPSDALTLIEGDIADSSRRALALGEGCDAIVHLANVPGGSAEASPDLSRRINLDASYDLLSDVALAVARPRLIFASSIAVLGSPGPAPATDLTPIAPSSVYGTHKAMLELAVDMLAQRGEVEGIALRLPAVLARPRGAGGLKSAFMSDLFHAIRHRVAFACPVGPTATIWAQSLECTIDNLVHALDLVALPERHVMTLPTLRCQIDQLVEEIARQCGAPASLVTYEPDPDLEAMFGSYPALIADAATAAGFCDDGSLGVMVERILATLADIQP